ncbi:MAG: hypothetical protein M5R36_23140 [Deltaproteobacteria bacterium]|nr:hypothetical protein [Deltaproteobacteria bacterium]
MVKLSAMVFVAVLLVPSIGGTHGGDAREEGAYHIAPKTAWDQPDAASMRVGDHEISRGEFLAYLQTVGENEIHADLLQRSFQLHFTLSQGIIRQHPQDADDLLKRIAAAETPSEEEAGQLKAWIAGQAELYAAIVASADKARAAGLDKTPEVRDVLDTFHRHLKADFLQDLVTYGTMEPTADAVRAYAAGLTPADKSGTAELFSGPRHPASV